MYNIKDKILNIKLMLGDLLFKVRIYYLKLNLQKRYDKYLRI